MMTSTTSSKYVIVVIRSFYGPREERSLYCGNQEYAVQFDTLKAAKAEIEGLDSERYYTAHNEASRPDYKACKVSSLPRYLAAQV